MSERAPRRPTMRDVGAHAGVSIKTVSRVVNGEATVAPELAERVRLAIADLGYRPDQAASSLRRSDGRSRTIAVVLEDLANPFSAALHRAVVDAARARGVLVLAASSDEDPVDERDAVAAFTARRVDGVVLMPTSAEHAWIDEERAAGTPIVMVDRPAGRDTDAVVSDNREGATRATNHLLRRGHRRVAFLGDLAEIYTVRERVAGYRAALQAAGAPADDGLVRLDLRSSDAAQQAVVDLLAAPDPPTALFPSQNLVTIGAVRALRQLGLHQDVALVGFDDIVLAELLEPGVTVVAQDPARIGRMAAERLLARIDGDDAPTGLHVVPTRLIPRGSGEIPAPAG
ncbi:MAG TPA: LacI family DNA-binding transcriptional regulator [Solirubrobacteraceae bacterium]